MPALLRRTPARRVDVVWAEDSGVDQFFIANVLAEAAPELRVDFAADGEAALRQATLNPPALLVLDYRMPRMDGLEALRRVRAEPTLAATPVVLFTSSVPDEPSSAMAATLGASFLRKPVDYGAFRAAVLHILQRVRQEAAQQDGAQPKPLVSLKPAPLPLGNHQVAFWATDAAYDATVGGFLQQAHDAGRTLIVLARPAHLARLQRLVRAPDAQWLDAERIANEIAPDGRPDALAFGRMFAQAFATASDGGRRPVACFGEVVDVLLERGHLGTALAIEAIGQQAAARQGDAISILCAYPASAMQDAAAFGAICAQHSVRILPDTTPAR